LQLGGLKALDDFLVNRKTNEFDTYVGLSAGAVLAAPVAMGISPAEMIKSLEGKSTEITRFRARDFYSPNLADLVGRPPQSALALPRSTPGPIGDLARGAPRLAEALRGALRTYFRSPSQRNPLRLLEPIATALWNHRDFPSILEYLPTG